MEKVQVNLKLDSLRLDILNYIGKHNISQSHFAFKCNVSSSLISRFLVSRECSLTMSSLLTISQILEKPVSYYMGIDSLVSVSAEGKNTIERICNVIKKDVTLDDEKKEGLCKLMEVAYRQLTL